MNSYAERRSQIAHYFDRTAVDAWTRLTSDAPVGRIRATVRAGRDQMRQALLDWMPVDMRGVRLLDAGCGTGALAVAAARRGARVTAIDLSPTLVQLARERMPDELPGTVDFLSGDMMDPALGTFDYVVAMDSLIHYSADDAVHSLAAFAPRVRRAMLFTFAPRTPALAVMHAVGRLFPRGDRAPAIEPVAEPALRALIGRNAALTEWQPGRTERIARGFYTSQALELRRA